MFDSILDLLAIQTLVSGSRGSDMFWLHLIGWVSRIFFIEKQNVEVKIIKDDLTQRRNFVLCNYGYKYQQSTFHCMELIL